MITGNEPISPLMGKNEAGDAAWRTTGITLRQYYTGLAMQGIVSQQAPVDRIISENNQSLTRQIAEASVIIADALVKALNNEQPTRTEEIIALLNNACERMERARGVLKGKNANWGMLDTSDLKRVLSNILK